MHLRRRGARWGAGAALAVALGMAVSGVGAPIALAAETAAVDNPDVTGDEWTTPQKVRVGQTPSRAVVVPFDTVAEAKASPTLEKAKTASPDIRLLNGTWQFNYVPKPADKPDVAGVTSIPSSGYQDITVPSSWQVAGKYAGALGTDYPIYNNQDYPFQASGGGVPNQGDFEASQAPTTFNPVGTYMRTLDLSADDIDGNRLLLSFLGVEAGFYLYVNGAVVGYGEDSFSTSDFDITDYVHEGTNLVTVQVYRWTTGSFVENQDGLDFGGIHRDVLLTVQPDVSIYDYNVETTFENHDYSASNLEVKVDVANTSAASAARTVKAHLYGADGQQVGATLTAPVTVAAGQSATATLSGTVANPLLWSAEVPNLYTLVMELADADGNTIQAVGKRVGFREFYMENAGTSNSTSNMRLNGQNIDFYGVNRGENDPAYGHHLTYADQVKDVVNAKQMNMNAIRTSHFPPDPSLIELADEYGLYVMDEVNNESHNGRDGINNTPYRIDTSLSSRDFPGNDSRYTNALKQRMTSMVMRDRSNASVIIYSLGNEAGTGPNFDTMIDVIKDLDGEELIHYQGDTGNPRVDMIGAMYPAYNAASRPDAKKPYIMMEYQHSMGNTGGELKRYTDAIEGSYRQQGGFLWDFVDQSAWTLRDDADPSDGVTPDELYFGADGDWPQVSGDGTFLQNGIVFADRSWKPEAFEVKAEYQDLKFTQTAAQRADHKVTMTNLNRFRDASYYEIGWSLQENGVAVQTGTLSPEQTDLAPPTGDIVGGSTKELTIPYGITSPKAGAEYQLLVEYRLKADAPYADAGYVQGSGQFPIDERGAEKLVQLDDLGTTQTDVTTGTVTITGTTTQDQPFEIGFDRTTGLMSTYEVDGKDLITRAPVGSFFRAETDQSAAVRGLAWDKNTPESYQGWFDQGENMTNVSVNVLSGTAGATKVVVHATLRNASTYATTYTVYADGTVAVDATLTPSDSSPEQLGEVGMMMQLSSDLENVTWYGRGPAENYWDRKAGTYLGRWESTVDEQFVPYQRIQEAGNKTDVRWMALTDDDGAGLLASMKYGGGYSGDPLEAVALHYTPKALSSYNSKDLYPYQAQRTDDVVLRLLKHQKGVGNLDWGSEPPSAMISKRDTDLLSYGYVLHPLAAGADPADVATDIYPEVGFPLLDSITVGGMPLTGFAPETFTYDYTLPPYYPSSPVPTVAATAPAGLTVTIDQPTAIPGTAVVHVVSASTTVDYTVNIAEAPRPTPTVQLPDIVTVPSLNANGMVTAGQSGYGKLLYAYSGYSKIGVNASVATPGPITVPSGVFDKGFQGNAEQIMDFDISDYDVTSFSGIAGIDPKEWGNAASITFEVWAHKDASQLTADYYAPMSPTSTGGGTIVSTGWTKIATSPQLTKKVEYAFDEVPLTYTDGGTTKPYQALRLVMNANGNNGHDQGVWADPRINVNLVENPEFRSIQMGGATLPGFAADKHAYSFKLAAGAPIPEVTVDSDEGIFTLVTPATSAPGTTTVRVGSETYTIEFTRDTAPDAQQAWLSDYVTVPAIDSNQSVTFAGNLLYGYSSYHSIYKDKSEKGALQLRASGQGADAVIKTYQHGFAGNANQIMDIDISNRAAQRFTADVGVDWVMKPDTGSTNANGPTVKFEVWAAKDVSTLDNAFYQGMAPTATGGTIVTDGWTRLDVSPVMSNYAYTGALETRKDLYPVDVDLTYAGADGKRKSYQAIRLVMDAANGSNSNDQGVWGDPQVTFLGDELAPTVDVTRLQSTVDADEVNIGYLYDLTDYGKDVRSITVAYDADNRMVGYSGSVLDAASGNQDGNQAAALPEDADPTSIAYLLLSADGKLTPLTDAFRRQAVTGDTFTSGALHEVLPPSDPAIEVTTDPETGKVIVTGTGFSPSSLIAVEGTVDGRTAPDHVAVLSVGTQGTFTYTYTSNSDLSVPVTVTVGGQGLTSAVTATSVTTPVVPVTGITVTGPGVAGGAVSATVGATVQLGTTVLPADATDASVTWSTSAAGVATVSASGLVTAMAAGTATITATAKDGSGVKGAVTVTVTTPVVPVTGITVTGPGVAGGAVSATVGATLALVATVTPAGATDKAVTWSTSAASVASVSTSGVVTAVAPGTATVTATAHDGSGIKGSVTVTVSRQPSSDATLASLSVAGQSVDLAAAASAGGASLTVVDPAAVTAADVQHVVADAGASAQVSIASGTVTVTVTAEDGTTTKVYRVVLHRAPVPVTSIEVTGDGVSGGKVSLVEGTGTALSASVLPTGADDRSVTWSTSDAAVATVSVDGGLLAVRPGTAVVTATANDGSGVTGTVEVTVTAALPWQAATATAVEVAPTSLRLGAKGTASVVLTARVSSNGGGVTAGTVRFTVDGRQVDAAVRQGVATATVTVGSVGTLAVSARYLGTVTTAPSAATASVSVAKAKATVTLKAKKVRKAVRKAIRKGTRKVELPVVVKVAGKKSFAAVTVRVKGKGLKAKNLTLTRGGTTLKVKLAAKHPSKVAVKVVLKATGTVAKATSKKIVVSLR